MASGEQKIQDDDHSYKCRIPQRLPPGRQKKTTEKNKQCNPDIVYIRPKSASRAKEDSLAVHLPPRSAQPNRERLLPIQKEPWKEPATGSTQKPGPSMRKPFNEISLMSGNKTMKQIITVPIASKQKPLGGLRTTYPNRNFSALPDQETIKKCEDLESQQNEQTGSTQMYHSEGNLHERDSITSRSEKVMRLKVNWQEQIVKFESMKCDLNERQGILLELYANLLGTHQKLSTLGHKANLPAADDLNIMNVAKMTPDQLLQLCSESKKQRNDNQLLTKIPLDFDLKKLNNMPTKLIALCEETLKKRKDIIDWFDTLRNQEKGCTVSSLTKKINEFNAENEMLYCSLDNIKSEFIKELNDIFDYLRKCVSKTVALQLRTEELTCTLSDMQSKNSDLRKQMYNADQCRSHNNKSRIEELEKMLKDERLMKITTKDRLSRAEGQIKIGEERAGQLEAALNLERMRTRDLERTVQQLKERNHSLQQEFDEELSKLNQSIKENTTHLEEIADAREKLQTEKEDLEKRLEELSNHYNESLDNIKQEQSNNVAKIIEIEKKYNDEIEERKKRDTQIEMLCTQLVETELRYKDAAKLLEEQTTAQISLQNNARNWENEIQSLKNEILKRNAEINEYKQNLKKKTNTVKEIEKKINQSLASEEKLKSEINCREKIISELKANQECMEEQLQNRDVKTKQYEEQLSSLKKELGELQERWGEIENIHGLPKMVNEQNAKLVEFARQNDDLVVTLENRNIKIEHLCDTLQEQEEILKQKEDFIKSLLIKEEEQANITKLLRNNIEMRAHVDTEINRQLAEKNAKIDSLLNNSDRLKQQINQLEKIILTLEDQIQKNTLQKKKDEERIRDLEEQLAKYNACRSEYVKEIENPADNLDNLIKILEEELNSPIETKLHRHQEFHANNKSRHDNRRQQCNPVFYQETLNTDNTFPTKIEMGNFVKKTYLPNKNDSPQLNDFECNTDVYGRNMQKCLPFHKLENVHTPPEFLINNNNIFAHFGDDKPWISRSTYSEDRNVTRNLQYTIPNDLKDEKKRKMFKLVGHRL